MISARADNSLTYKKSAIRKKLALGFDLEGSRFPDKIVLRLRI